MPKTYRLQLTKRERQALLEIATTGRHAAREVIRAQVLLKSADGWTESQLAATLSITENTVKIHLSGDSGTPQNVARRPGPVEGLVAAER